MIRNSDETVINYEPPAAVLLNNITNKLATISENVAVISAVQQLESKNIAEKLGKIENKIASIQESIEKSQELHSIDIIYAIKKHWFKVLIFTFLVIQGIDLPAKIIKIQGWL